MHIHLHTHLILAKMGLGFGVSFPLGAVLLIFASLHPTSHAATKIVGGSDHWKWGVNYTDWALKNGPFYLNDTLVFLYDPPTNGTFPHSVSLLKGAKSFAACNFKTGKMVANITQGAGKGFPFVLKKPRPHYFACGEHNGTHCTIGKMKFSVTPLRRPCNHG